MSTKLSISLQKLEALVLSATSRTTAKGDDASVVKAFTPAWEDNDANKADKFGGAALAFADGTFGYINPHHPTSDDNKKLNVVTKAGSEGTMRDKTWCSAKIMNYTDPILTVGGVGGKKAGEVSVDVGGVPTLVHLSPTGDPFDSVDVSMPGGVAANKGLNDAMKFVGRADGWMPWKGGEIEPEILTGIGLPACRTGPRRRPPSSTRSPSWAVAAATPSS